MTPWQQANQMRYLLLGETWSGGDAVFGSVVVTAGAQNEAALMAGMRTPAVLIQPTNAPSDDESPDLIQQGWRVWLIVSGHADALGESALLGAARSSGLAGGEGRGLLEVEEVLRGVLYRAMGDVGLRAYVRVARAAGTVLDQSTKLVAYRPYELDTQATQTRRYDPCSFLTATPASTSVALAWRVPPDRFDRLRVVLRRAAGSTAPATYDAGTGVTLSADLATSVTDSGLSSSTTYSYAIFALYDDYPTNAQLMIARGTPATHRSTSASRSITVTTS